MDFSSYPSGGILSPLPGDLKRDYGQLVITIFEHNFTAQYVYELPD